MTLCDTRSTFIKRQVKKDIAIIFLNNHCLKSEAEGYQNEIGDLQMFLTQALDT